MLLSYNVSHTQYTHTCTKVDKRKSTSPIIGGAEITEISNAVDIYIYIYRVSQEERAKLREGVPYVKLYRYNPKHLYPKLNGFRDNGK